MSNEERRKQMVTEAKAYTAKFYDDGSADSKTKTKTEETFTDFCAGWMAADKSRWIPVDKELPKENEEVLAYNAENEEVIACDYHHKMFHCWPEAFKESITHWMPKPTPPASRKEV